MGTYMQSILKDLVSCVIKSERPKALKKASKTCTCLCIKANRQSLISSAYSIIDIMAFLLQERTPNLGWLIALMTVSPKHKWGHLAVPLLMETLDRNVLWSCKARESLVQHYQVPEHSGGIFPILY